MMRRRGGGIFAALTWPYLLHRVMKGAREHIGEEFERYRQQELHKWDHKEESKRNESKSGLATLVDTREDPNGALQDTVDAPTRHERPNLKLFQKKQMRHTCAHPKPKENRRISRCSSDRRPYRSRSVVVRINWRLSRRVRFFPRVSLRRRPMQILTS